MEAGNPVPLAGLPCFKFGLFGPERPQSGPTLAIDALELDDNWKDSLLISLLTGNLARRIVRGRLPPPPARLLTPSLRLAPRKRGPIYRRLLARNRLRAAPLATRIRRKKANDRSTRITEVPPSTVGLVSRIILASGTAIHSFCRSANVSPWPISSGTVIKSLCRNANY
jgi:hypothetical protein